jgi:hypothetical protein
VTNPFRFADPGPFLHRVAIARRLGGGTTNPTTGKYEPPVGDPTTIVNGTGAEPNADMQDTQRVLARDASGTPTLTARGQCFLKDETLIDALAIGDTGTVAGEEYGAGVDFEVVGLQRIDGSFFVNWL